MIRAPVRAGPVTAPRPAGAFTPWSGQKIDLVVLLLRHERLMQLPVSITHDRGVLGHGHNVVDFPGRLDPPVSPDVQQLAVSVIRDLDLDVVVRLLGLLAVNVRPIA